MKKLNLGCGQNYKYNWVNQDISNKDIYNVPIKVDIIYDLNNYNWIWKDNTFNEINAISILEHLENRIKPLNELKRISKNGCIIKIRVPHYSGYIAYGDPTHYHKYSFQAGNMIAKMWNFKLLENKIIYSSNKFLKWINPIVNLFPKFYERFLCNIFPSQELIWKFKVIKN